MSHHSFSLLFSLCLCIILLTLFTTFASTSTSNRITSLPHLVTTTTTVPSYTGYLSFQYSIRTDKKNKHLVLVAKKNESDPGTKSSNIREHQINDLFDAPYLNRATNGQNTREKQEVDNVNSRQRVHLFYWYWPMISEQAGEDFDDTVPLFVVVGGGGATSSFGAVNGSIGCSFMSRLLFESGPIVLSPLGEGQDQFVLNERSRSDQMTHTWNRLGNVLYIDAPAMTGYSYVDMKDGVKRGNGTPNRAQFSALDLQSALREFMVMYPKLKNSQVYFVTSDYDTKTVLYLNQILKSDPDLTFQIMGNVIFDPVLYPSIQYPTMVPYDYMRGYLSYGDTVRVTPLVQSCLEEAKKDKIVNCESLFEQVTRSNTVDISDSRVTQLNHAYEDLLLRYLNDSAVLTTLGVANNIKMESICSRRVYDSMKYDIHVDAPHDLLSNVLDKYNVPLLFATDIFNIRSNPKGVQEMLRTVYWSGREFFNAQRATALTDIDLEGEYDGRLHGSFKSYNGLTQYLAFNGIYRGAEVEREFTNQQYFNTPIEVLKRYSTKSASTNALCDINDAVDCVTDQSYCPNECSGHGNCVSDVTKDGAMACKCNSNYKTLDCSAGHFSYDSIVSGRPLKDSFQGFLFGQESNVFKLALRSDSNYLELDVSSTLLTGVGNIALLVNVSEAQQEIDDSEIKRLSLIQSSEVVRSNQNNALAYFHISANGTSQIRVPQAPITRHKQLVVTIVVLNDFHTKCTYRLDVSIKAASAVPFGLTTIFFGLSMLLILIVIGQAYLISHQHNKKRSSYDSLKQSHSDHVSLLSTSQR